MSTCRMWQPVSSGGRWSRWSGWPAPMASAVTEHVQLSGDVAQRRCCRGGLLEGAQRIGRARIAIKQGAWYQPGEDAQPVRLSRPQPRSVDQRDQLDQREPPGRTGLAVGAEQLPGFGEAAGQRLVQYRGH